MNVVTVPRLADCVHDSQSCGLIMNGSTGPYHHQCLYFIKSLDQAYCTRAK